jgi:Protein of unknown function (DUF3131)
MTFKEGLLSARSHIIFLLGLFASFGLIFYLDGLQLQTKNADSANQIEIPLTQGIPEPVHGELTDLEREWAEIAWTYFRNNYQKETGLVNSVDEYPATSMWDTASYLMALISAQRLQIIDNKEFEEKLGKALNTLAQLSLFDGQLPNKSYNTISLQMADYKNNVTDRGIGWSAIDVGRILVPLNIIMWNYPKFMPEIRAIVSKWQLPKLLINGELQGATVDPATNKTVYVQEGRLGYEEYSAKSFNLLGLDVSKSMNYKDYLAFVDIYGIEIPIDKRDPEKFHAHNYVVSENYILDGLEYGWDYLSKEFAYRVFKAQEARYQNTGLVTAVSEDNIKDDPYFVYNTVYTDGKAWNAIGEKGEDATQYKTISTKAAIGWSILYKTPYSQKLVDAVKHLYDPKKGWYSGYYEVLKKTNEALSANTNAIILETLCFKKFGRLLAVYPDMGSVRHDKPGG